MSTDTNQTSPADLSEPATLSDPTHQPEPSAESSLQASEQQQPEPPDGSAAATQLQDDGAQAESDPPPPARLVAQSVAETAWDDEDSEPGDDIGNRADGPAHHERTTTSESDAGGSRRHRQRKKRGPGGLEGREASTASDSHDPAAGAGPRKPKPKQPSAPSRERPAFRVGEEVFGKVVEVSDTAVLIDLSGKAQAIFDRNELSADSIPQVGDHFVALVHGDGSRGGRVVLTRSPDRAERSKQKLEAASSSGDSIDGLITGVIKGGVEVDADGIRAFAPGSHVDLKLGADLQYLVGKRLPFKVMKYAKNGREVVLSRRTLLEQEAAAARKSALSQLEPGMVVQAVVRSVVDWGVFVAIPQAGNIEGLVHVTEASHDRSAKLSGQFHTGDTIEVKVLRIDDKGKLWLSRKAVAADPWDANAQRFAVGTRHTGRVARIQPFGAFVELAPGIDGLVRTSDLSVRRVNDPKEVVNVGDEIEVVVVHLDVAQRKIGLHPAPPKDEQEPAQRVAPNRVLRVKVMAAEASGLLVRILGVTGGSSRGFVPAGQTGTSRGTDLRREFPVGTVLEAKALEVDSRRGECKLSIRALKEDSEKAAFNEYRATVARESKFGTFGDLFAKRNGSS
jgi:small subunit ribosomal protein S1